LITTNEKLAKNWGDYFNTLLNSKESDDIFNPNLETGEEQKCLEQSLDEIRSQIYTF
jgi:hypothetical protein